MKLLYLIFLTIPCCMMTFAQQQCHTTAQQQMPNSTPDTLHWSNDRKLTWDDFQGVPDSTSPGGAGTSSGFVTKSRYTSDTTISVVISAVFYKKKSWQKTQYQTARSLKHEQGHFDITEVYARKATSAFKRYRYRKATVNDDIVRIFNLFAVEKDKMQFLYDKETSNHRNFKKQKEWDRKISIWLKNADK